MQSASQEDRNEMLKSVPEEIAKMMNAPPPEPQENQGAPPEIRAIEDHQDAPVPKRSRSSEPSQSSGTNPPMPPPSLQAGQPQHPPGPPPITSPEMVKELRRKLDLAKEQFQEEEQIRERQAKA